MTRPSLLNAALLLTLVLGCTSADPVSTLTPAGTSTAATKGTASATGTPTSGTPAAAATGTATPCVAPTAAPGATLVASTAAIPTASLPKVRFVPTGGAAIVSLPLEVPPDCEYGIGLSGRTSLIDRGMLFYFTPPGDIPFYMKDTLIDLDIAFVDTTMKVIGVETMKKGTLDHHKPGKPYMAAIEAPPGWYAARNIMEGATVIFDFDLKATTGR